METSSLLDQRSISSDEDDLDAKWSHEKPSKGAVPSRRGRLLGLAATASLFLGGALVGLGLGILSSAAVGWPLRLNKCALCIKQISRPSPILHDLEITYHEQMFNGSLLEETIYRLDGSPEVDAAWDALGASPRPMLLSLEEALNAGVPSDWVHVTRQYGGGYLTYVEGLHHLHCLNLLRQSLYFNIDYYRNLSQGGFLAEGRRMHRLHVTHCLDILRQQLMCTVEIGVFGERWAHAKGPVENVEGYPDFNTKHVCRNFDDVRKWALDRQVDEHTLHADGFLEAPSPQDRIYHGIP